MSELSCNFATNISRYSIAHREQPMALRKHPIARREPPVRQRNRAAVHGGLVVVLGEPAILY